MRSVRCLIFIPFFFQLSAGWAQQINSWSLEGQRGFIIPHSEELIPIAQSDPKGMQLSFERLFLGRDAWSACNCFHYVGVNFSYHDFRNPDILGQAMTLSGSFEPVLWRGERWQVTIKTAIGISYLTKVYDEIKNPENTFFSSHVSFLMSVSPKIRYRLSENLSTRLSFNYNHISNGGQKQPNRGMNFPMRGLGFSYAAKNYGFPTYEPDELSKKASLLLDLNATLRDNPIGDGRVDSFGISADIGYPISYLNAFGVGLEANWDMAVKKQYDGKAFIPGFYIAHHLLFGKFDFTQRMALYLHKPKGYQSDRSFYQRYIINYQLPGNLKVGIGMKVHGHVAENIEMRLGYAL